MIRPCSYAMINVVLAEDWAATRWSPSNPLKIELVGHAPEQWAVGGEKQPVTELQVRMNPDFPVCQILPVKMTSRIEINGSEAYFSSKLSGSARSPQARPVYQAKTLEKTWQNSNPN